MIDRIFLFVILGTIFCVAETNAESTPETINIGGVDAADYLFKDLRSETQTAELGQGVMVYAATILARWSGPDKEEPGHAYIVLSEWRNNGESYYWSHPLIFGMNPDFEASTAAGMNPTGDGLIYHFLKKERGADAVMLDETPAVAIQVWIDTATYQSLQNLAAEWETKNYQLLTKDCLTFAREAAKTAGLTVPARLAEYPVTHLQRIIEANK